MNRYYCYRHVRIDKNEVFYVGIGTIRDRTEAFNSWQSQYERAYVRENRNAIWQNIVAKTEYRVDILFECETEAEIKEKEREFILFYGRRDLSKGTLVNLTNGGDRYEFSIETRQKISRSLKGRHVPIQVVEKFKANNRSEEVCGKKVYEYDSVGRFVTVWPSVVALSKAIGKAPGSIKKAIYRSGSCNDSQFFYEDKGPRVQAAKVSKGTNHAKAVVKLNIQRNPIKRYKTVTEASLDAGRSIATISMAIKNSNSVKGFFYEFCN